MFKDSNVKGAAKMIAIIDYGAGNLHSVKNAFDYIGVRAEITGDAKYIAEADAVVLPGVGAFGDCMKSLEKRDLIQTVKDAANSGKPFLGICLGLQLLFEESEESPGVKGLGIFKGKIVKIPDSDGLKIPHMGWNNIMVTKESKILSGSPFVYFVHSYYLKTNEKDIISAYTEYGKRLDIAVERGNIFAVQFHPEKSGDAGMNILRRFAALGGDR